MKAKRVALLCAVALAVVMTSPAMAEPVKKKRIPVLLQSDQLLYDQEANTTTAQGHVELMRDGQILRADKIVYNKNTDVVKAYGHVTLLQSTGDVLFAEEAELTSDMAQGFMEKIGIVFIDGSRLAAADARRYGGRYLIADRGLYTACKVCASNPEDPPLWQIRAKRITDDGEKKNVMYRDAVIEFAGVPVFYTPYFSHPEPSVKQRQGFLSPTGGGSQNLGSFAKVPYYFVFDQNSDMTLAPTFSSNDGLQVANEFRHRFGNASIRVNSSFAYTDLVSDQGVDKGKQLRGNVFGDAVYNIDKKWRTGGVLALTTDKSYLSRYSIAHEDVLVNRGYVENFEGRNYGATNFYYFQDLRPGSRLKEPIIAPEVRYSMLGEPGKTLGGRWSLDSGFLMTSRKRDVAIEQQGPDTRRLSLSGGWERELVSSTGFLTDISALMRTDAYWADNVTDPNNSMLHHQNVTDARPFAQGSVTLRYPLGRRGDGYQQLVEPIVQLTVAPNMPKSPLLPNEDSLDVEFDETNLFASNRFTGIDRLEGGTRTSYGVRQTLIADGGGRIELMAGQSYRMKENDQFKMESGIRDKLSDYVGRIDFQPVPWFDMNYGFMLDKDTFSPKRHALRGNVGNPIFRPFVNYLSIDQTTVGTATNSLEEITGGFSSTFYKYYTVVVSQKNAMRPTSGPRLTSISADYADECFLFGLTAQRDHTVRADLSSGDTIIFHFYMKNIGGMQSSTISTSPTANN
ncbi:MAG: LPS assembly protein LptD [Alphaproteobacteria bacterium]|nr:LPS assembly protein LptD [Alphaproteobacteria bacterium]